VALIGPGGKEIRRLSGDVAGFSDAVAEATKGGRS
jgi:hypothetical protein